MKHFRNLLQYTGNLFLMSLLIGLVALPAVSSGMMGVKSDGGEVLSTEDVRLNISPEDIRSGKYYYNYATGHIELKKVPVINQYFNRGFDSSYFDEPADTEQSTETIDSTNESTGTQESIENTYPPVE